MNTVAVFQQRTDNYVAAIAKGAAALVSARESLSLEGLKVVEITVEALKVRGKTLRDETAKQAAYDLELDRLTSAAWIAQQIVNRDKPTRDYMAGKDHKIRMNKPLGVPAVLIEAGWDKYEANRAVAVARLKKPELVAAKKKRLSITKIMGATIGRGNRKTSGRLAASQSYRNLCGFSGSRGLTDARQVLKALSSDDFDDLSDSAEIVSIRNRLIELRDWCDDRIKQLKRTK